MAVATMRCTFLQVAEVLLERGWECLALLRKDVVNSRAVAVDRRRAAPIAIPRLCSL